MGTIEFETYLRGVMAGKELSDIGLRYADDDSLCNLASELRYALTDGMAD